MADIDEKRITSISDTDISIPVRWANSATEIRWNNAIAMAVTIARTIDRMNLWDGYLHFKEKTGYFKIEERLFKTSNISDKFNVDIENPIGLMFTEFIPYNSINIPFFKTSDIVESMPCEPMSVYSTDDSTIYIEMSNPIYSNNASENIAAFEITATFGGLKYTFNPKQVVLNDVSGIALTVENMSQATGEINVLYRSEKGNLMSSITDTSVDSFNKAFTYSITYSEGG